jgi:hypothetical protein
MTTTYGRGIIPSQIRGEFQNLTSKYKPILDVKDSELSSGAYPKYEGAILAFLYYWIIL